MTSPKAIAHWIDQPAITKCGQTEETWKGVKVKFTEPGWYTRIVDPTTRGKDGIWVILMIANADILVHYDLCRKCKPLPVPASRPETVEELLEPGVLEKIVAKAARGRIGVLEPDVIEALRAELSPPPPPPGSWEAEGVCLWRGGAQISNLYDEGPVDFTAGSAKDLASEMAQKLNAFELDQVAWKPVAEALGEHAVAGVGTKGEKRCKVIDLLSKYGDNRHSADSRKGS